MTAPPVTMTPAEVRAQLRAIRRAVNDRKLAAQAATRVYRITLTVAIGLLTLAMLVFPFIAGAAERGLLTLRTGTTTTSASASSAPASSTAPASTTRTSPTTAARTAGLFASTTPTATSSIQLPQPLPQHSPAAGSTPAKASAGKSSRARHSIGDFAELEVWGSLGGLVGAVVALRTLKGARRPPGLQIAQIVLKIPAGALFALFGVALLQAHLLPTITPATNGQLVAYAMLFGFAQEAVTRAIDKRAGSLLDSAG